MSGLEERDWLVLKTLFAKKSISNAARTLFISQPALSSRLQQIENRFGAQIVIRGKKGVQFTPEGEYLVKYACRMLQEIQVVEETIQNMKQEPAGVLKIGASDFFTKYLMPELLRQFQILFPLVEFKVITGWSRDIVNAVYLNEVHIGFIRGDYSFPGEKYLLFSERMFVASKSDFEFTDLRHRPRIDYRSDYTVQTLLDKWWNENYACPPYVGMEVDRMDTCKEMLEKGLGYGFLPELILSRPNTLCTKEMVYRSGKPVTRDTWMFYNKEAMELKTVKAFFDFITTIKFSCL